MINDIKQGLDPHIADGTEFQLGAIINWPKLSDLQEEFWTIPVSIKDQGKDENDDYCASAAGSGMIEPEEESELFYPFLFAAAKYESGKDVDSFGLNLKDIGKALTKWGVPEIKDVPQAIKDLSPSQRRRFENYPDSLRQLAKKHQQQTYFFLDNSPYDAFDTARAAIQLFKDKKQKIIFGVLFGWSLTDYILDGTPTGSGHAMWCSGSDKEGLVIVNSYGLSAGKGGMHRMTRATFNYYAKTYGMMMIVDIPRSDAEYMLKNQLIMQQISLIDKVIMLIRQLLNQKYVQKTLAMVGEIVLATFSPKQND